MDWICALRRFSFYFVHLFLFTILWKLRLDQQNAHSKWLFSCMCLKCFALEQSLHVSWHSTAYSAAYFKHWELFKVNFKKKMVQETRNGFIEIILQRNSVIENRSNTRKGVAAHRFEELSRTGNLPVNHSFSFISKTRDVTSGVSDPLKHFCSLLVSLISHGANGIRCKRNKKFWLNILVWCLLCQGRMERDWKKNRLNCLKNSCKKRRNRRKTLQKNFSPFSWPLKVKYIP